MMGLPKPKAEKPPPLAAPMDGAAWARAVQEKSLDRFRLEDLVAAIQDLRSSLDKATFQALCKHLSDCMLKMLRQRIRKSYPNQGEDIIEKVNGTLWEAILTPDSKDGKALRQAFTPRLEFRVKDALREHSKQRRTKPLASSDDEPDSDDDILSTAAAKQPFSQRTADAKLVEDRIDIERALAKIDDPRKRLAYRLHVGDGVPCKSKDGPSVAVALGVSEKTAREWIKEVQQFLDSTVEKDHD